MEELNLKQTQNEAEEQISERLRVHIIRTLNIVKDFYKHIKETDIGDGINMLWNIIHMYERGDNIAIPEDLYKKTKMWLALDEEMVNELIHKAAEAMNVLIGEQVRDFYAASAEFSSREEKIMFSRKVQEIMNTIDREKFVAHVNIAREIFDEYIKYLESLIDDFTDNQIIKTIDEYKNQQIEIKDIPHLKETYDKISITINYFESILAHRTKESS